MPNPAATLLEESDVLRRLLQISAKEFESYAELAREYLQAACDLLGAPEAALNNGGARTWHWHGAAGRLVACPLRDLRSGTTISFERQSGATGRLVFPGRSSLSWAERDVADLVAMAAGQALDRFAVHQQRIRRIALQREREQLLQRFISGGSVTDALNGIAALVERHANCKAALLAVDGWAVECIAAPSLPAQYKSASSALGGLTPAPMATETVITLPGAPAFGYRARHVEIAAELGFPYCESVPVLSRTGEMLGLLIAHCASEPVRATREILRNVGRVASLVMEHRRLEQRAGWLAEHDPLTGLPSRDALQKVVRAAMADGHAENLAVLFISLDRFRNINGALGRTAGDLVIKRAAERMASAIDGRDFAARSTGDEFLVVLIGRPDPAAVLAAAAEIRAAVAGPFHIAGNEVAITCSIGISALPEGGPDADSLLRNAEIAMLRARDKGCGRVEAYTARASADGRPSRFIVERELRNAVERNELELRFQPVVTSSGALHGFEVLLSWQHPEYGRIPAAHFIPIAEDADLILPIGDWVLRRVCSQAAQWQSRAEALRFWINVSARQFTGADFVDRVRSAVSASGVDPCSLVLELTETVIMRDMEESARLMSDLRAAGLRLAIDDFGTGYSSLNYLRTFPVNAIKIDQSFVRDLSNSSRALAVMESIVGLGHTLGLEVVAEGIETQAQFDILRRAGCDLAQGYLFGRPMPAHEAEALIIDGCLGPSSRF